MNTDIRQRTFEGFELPDVFLAAVESSARRRAVRANPAAAEGEAEDTPLQGELIDDGPKQCTRATRPETPPFDMTGRRSTSAAHARPTSMLLLAFVVVAMLTTLAANIAQPALGFIPDTDSFSAP